jgi:DNA (cytosine-5)-methyltransferase 1
MNYLSVCSGIEAATVAWHPLGWTPVAFAEIEKFPSAVLAHYYPSVPNWGDMTKFKDWPDANVDVLVGGTPCQSFSVAGLRKGLDDPRGNLALTYLAIADRYRPRWVVWENVPGVLSSGGGRDFGAFLGGLGQLGYGFAYRVLDAQYFGVAQRRRRVFVVGYLGDWRRAAAVLFDGESLSGHPAPRRETGQAAPCLPAQRTGGGGPRGDFHYDGGLVPERARALTTSNQRIDAESETLLPIDMRQASRGDKLTNNRSHGSGGAPGTGVGEPGDPAFTVTDRVQAIFDERQLTSPDNRSTCSADGTAPTMHEKPFTLAIRGRGDSHDLEYRQDETANAILTPNGGRGGIGVGAVAFANTAGDTALGLSKPGVPPITGRNGDPGNVFQPGMAVRRLTPRECERLQGFPDDYTLIPYRGKPAVDGPRYKALGNSMAVPVMRWIGQRIQLVATVVKEHAA